MDTRRAIKQKKQNKTGNTLTMHKGESEHGERDARGRVRTYIQGSDGKEMGPRKKMALVT